MTRELRHRTIGGDAKNETSGRHFAGFLVAAERNRFELRENCGCWGQHGRRWLAASYPSPRTGLYGIRKDLTTARPPISNYTFHLRRFPTRSSRRWVWCPPAPGLLSRVLVRKMRARSALPQWELEECLARIDGYETLKQVIL